MAPVKPVESSTSVISVVAEGARLFDQERRPIKEKDEGKPKQGTGKKEEVIPQCRFRHKGVVEGDEPEHAEAQRTEGRDGELVNQDGEVKIFLTEPQGPLVETQKQTHVMPKK